MVETVAVEIRANIEYSTLIPHSLIEDTITQFRDLAPIYNKIRVVIIGGPKKSRFKEKEEIEFLGEKPKSFRNDLPALQSCEKPPNGMITIDLDQFTCFSTKKKICVIRHECCHLYHHADIERFYERLVSKYGEEFAKNIIRFQREYTAHSCMISRWPEDWLDEPLGFKSSIKSPENAYEDNKRTSGKKSAILFGITNIIHMLSLLSLYSQIPTDINERLGDRKSRLDAFIRRFYKKIRDDLDNKKQLSKPKEWLTNSDFISIDDYIRKILLFMDTLTI
jgi:hypothetical protein